jgi:hypothetical protein
MWKEITISIFSWKETSVTTDRRFRNRYFNSSPPQYEAEVPIIYTISWSQVAVSAERAILITEVHTAPRFLYLFALLYIYMHLKCPEVQYICFYICFTKHWMEVHIEYLTHCFVYNR